MENKLTEKRGLCWITKSESSDKVCILRWRVNQPQQFLVGTAAVRFQRSLGRAAGFNSRLTPGFLWKQSYWDLKPLLDSTIKYCTLPHATRLLNFNALVRSWNFSLEIGKQKLNSLCWRRLFLARSLEKNGTKSIPLGQVVLDCKCDSWRHLIWWHIKKQW